MIKQRKVVIGEWEERNVERHSVSEEAWVRNWWNEAGWLSRMESKRKTAVLGYCQIEHEGRNRCSCFPVFRCKCCLCKVRLIQNILVWAGSTTRHCSGNREGKNPTLWSNCDSNKWQAEYCWVFNTLRSCLLRIHYSMGLKDAACFLCSGWLELGNILIDVFSLIKPMNEHLWRTQILDFLRNVFKSLESARRAMTRKSKCSFQGIEFIGPEIMFDNERGWSKSLGN